MRHVDRQADKRQLVLLLEPCGERLEFCRLGCTSFGALARPSGFPDPYFGTRRAILGRLRDA